MCGIVGVLGNHEEAARSSSKRSSDWNIAAMTAPGSPRSARAGSTAAAPLASWRTCRTCWSDDPCAANRASAIPAGPPMARPQSTTRTRTGRAGWPWSITGSSRITAICGRAWPPRASASPPTPTPRRWRSLRTPARYRARPRAAARETLRRLEGAFALAFLFDGEPDLMVAARKGSPLASAMARARCSSAPTRSPCRR